jgi:hypothetical protein
MLNSDINCRHTTDAKFTCYTIGVKEMGELHTCSALDERECSIMKHLILAEISKSNVPDWVGEELERKLYCPGCRNALVKRPDHPFD